MINKKETEIPFRLGLIGKKAEIQTQNGKLCGKITMETKNTIKIETKKGEKTLLKNNIIIKVMGQKIEGNKIKKRIEDRIKAR